MESGVIPGNPGKMFLAAPFELYIGNMQLLLSLESNEVKRGPPKEVWAMPACTKTIVRFVSKIEIIALNVGLEYDIFSTFLVFEIISIIIIYDHLCTGASLFPLGERYFHFQNISLEVESSPLWKLISEVDILLKYHATFLFVSYFSRFRGKWLLIQSRIQVIP